MRLNSTLHFLGALSKPSIALSARASASSTATSVRFCVPVASSRRSTPTSRFTIDSVAPLNPACAGAIARVSASNSATKCTLASVTLQPPFPRTKRIVRSALSDEPVDPDASNVTLSQNKISDFSAPSSRTVMDVTVTSTKDARPFINRHLPRVIPAFALSAFPFARSPFARDSATAPPFARSFARALVISTPDTTNVARRDPTPRRKNRRRPLGDPFGDVDDGLSTLLGVISTNDDADVDLPLPKIPPRARCSPRGRLFRNDFPLALRRIKFNNHSINVESFPTYATSAILTHLTDAPGFVKHT